MASTDLRADSARDNPASDELTYAFTLAFDNWRLCDDPPVDRIEEVSRIDRRLAEWQYRGACDAVVRSTPQNAVQAAIIALLAHDEIDTLIGNHSQDDGFPPRALTSAEVEVLRMTGRSLFAVCRHLHENGGELPNSVAEFFGLASAHIATAAQPEAA